MYLGIDGGGTKTAFTVMDASHTIIHSLEKGPTAMRSVPFETVLKTLIEGIQEIMAKHVIDSMVIGLGDVSGLADEIKVIKALNAALPLKNVLIKVVNDVIIAHAGALEGRHGIVLISGTGSVAYGTDGFQVIRVGGISYLEGDEGSAYHLGRLAMKHVAKVIDGREVASALSDTLIKTFKIDTFSDVVDWFEEKATSRTNTAALAKTVVELAAQDDSTALRLVDHAIAALIQLITPIHTHLKPDALRLGLVGGVAQEKTVIQPRLIAALEARHPGYEVFDAKKAPAIGACLMAMALKKD
jgi:N-acetylglucosamine kinase-like BadF-type ATPase